MLPRNANALMTSPLAEPGQPAVWRSGPGRGRRSRPASRPSTGRPPAAGLLRLPAGRPQERADADPAATPVPAAASRRARCRLPRGSCCHTSDSEAPASLSNSRRCGQIVGACGDTQACGSGASCCARPRCVRRGQRCNPGRGAVRRGSLPTLSVSPAAAGQAVTACSRVRAGRAADHGGCAAVAAATGLAGCAGTCARRRMRQRPRRHL